MAGNSYPFAELETKEERKEEKEIHLPSCSSAESKADKKFDDRLDHVQGLLQ